MTGQMTLDLALRNDVVCAKWCADHPQATAFIVNRAKTVNAAGRKCSMRLDCEPELARRAREWGLDGGTYRGIDHRLTADLARYLEATRGVQFNTRRRAGEPL